MRTSYPASRRRRDPHGSTATRSMYLVAPRRPGADVVVLRGSRAALVQYEGTHAAPNSGIRLSSPQVIQRAKKEKENRYRDSNQVLTRCTRKLNLEIRSLWRTWLDVPRLVELREIGGTYPLGHSDSWLTVFFVAHEVDDQKTPKARRARGRHCNPPAENRPRAFCSRRDDRDGPLTAAGRPASRTVQSSGFESQGPPKLLNGRRGAAAGRGHAQRFP